MAVRYLGDYSADGQCLGRAAADKIGFYGITTPIVQPSTITTVDTTTVTTVDTTTITAVEVATATTTDLIGAANILITDSQLQAETINKLVADSRAQAVAINTLISRLQSLNLIAT